MSTKEEIREVIDTYTDDECLYRDKDCAWCSKEGYCASDNDSYTCLMKRLGELGVVIKVKRELPIALIGNSDAVFGSTRIRGSNEAIEYMLKAGYEAVEPLIKEV